MSDRRIGERRLEWAKGLHAGETRGIVAVIVRVEGGADRVASTVHVALSEWLASAPSRPFPPPTMGGTIDRIFLADAVQGFATRVYDADSLRVEVATDFTAWGWKDWIVEDMRSLLRSLAGVRESDVVWPWQEE